jgi:hypothetical protein
MRMRWSGRNRQSRLEEREVVKWETRSRPGWVHAMPIADGLDISFHIDRLYSSLT